MTCLAVSEIYDSALDCVTSAPLLSKGLQGFEGVISPPLLFEGGLINDIPNNEYTTNEIYDHDCKKYALATCSGPRLPHEQEDHFGDTERMISGADPMTLRKAIFEIPCIKHGILPRATAEDLLLPNHFLYNLRPSHNIQTLRNHKANMSATINDNAAKAVSNQTGEIGSHVPRTGPIETSGVRSICLSPCFTQISQLTSTTKHQPGRQVGNNAAPESHIQTLPAGSAPPSRTFAPQNDADVPASGDAAATLAGATSADVAQVLGQPVQGQSSAELRHDGKSHRAGEGGGLQSVPAEHAPTADGPREGYGKQEGIRKPADMDDQ